MSDCSFNTLAECRDAIDEIDRTLLRVLNQRTVIVERIGALKQSMKMAVYEPRREDEVFANIKDHNAGPLPPEAAKRIFERIIDEMRNVQKLKIQEGDG